MAYTPVTPFRRPMEAVQTQPNPPSPHNTTDVLNKWDILRDLRAASSAYGLSNRELTVLQALLSFHPGTDLNPGAGRLVVFPSNATLAERLNGMPCSTMRRHLARLVGAGMIHRRDSPNGKRYVRRADGNTFGFDLTPLVEQAHAIRETAERLRHEAETLQLLRQDILLMRRDLIVYAEDGQLTDPKNPLWYEILDVVTNDTPILRRKMRREVLDSMAERLRNLITRLHGLSTNDAQNEQHIHNSKPEDLDSKNAPDIPIETVLETCTAFQDMVGSPIHHWHDLIRAAHILRPMLGINAQVWNDALTVMGPQNASTVLVAVLERFDEIRNHGGYLRVLTEKARAGTFSCKPMVQALGQRCAA